MEPLTLYERLGEYLQGLGPCVLAFSGGVDSTLLLRALADTGADHLAITVSTAYIPRWEIARAQQIAARLGVAHLILEIELLAQIRTNPVQRCYLCKKHMFRRLQEVAQQHGQKHVLEGSQQDDLQDYRPGLQALQELQITSPLLKLGFTKAHVREVSRRLGLPTWDQPAYACLLSRLPHDTVIEIAVLRRIERAEEYLREVGLQAVRVRTHGNLARIEIPAHEHIQLISNQELVHQICGQLQSYGYRYITLDLQGYTQGSMSPELERG